MFQFNNKTIKQYINKCRGMTLIEVLAVVAIILILTAAVVINPRPSVDLDRAARQLASDLRRAQNMAMSAEEYSGSVPYGYGIYFNINNKDEYILFADNDGGGTWSGVGETVETISLEKGVTISNGSSFNVFFEIPYGAITMPSDPFNIGLQLSSDTRTVTVTSAGKIEL